MDKKNRKIVIQLGFMITLMLSVLLSGCGKAESLEDYIQADKNAEQAISSMEESLGENGSIEIKGNAIIMTYTYSKSYDEDQIAVMRQSLEKSIDEAFSSPATVMLNQLSKESGFDEIALTVRFIDANGTEIYSKTYQ